MFSRLCVGAVHADSDFLCLEGSISSAAEWVREAGQLGLDIVVFPESFVPGFPYWVNLAAPPRTSELFVEFYLNAIPTGQLKDRLRPVIGECRGGHVSAILGLTERDRGTLFNSLVFIDARRGGISLVRRKLVPTSGERTVWGYGDASTLRAVDFEHYRASGMMCFEHTMHLARHTLSLEDCDMHAAAWPCLDSLPAPPGFYRCQVGALVQSYALMAQTYVVSVMGPLSATTACRLRHKLGPSIEVPAPCTGWSTVVDPFGQIVAEYDGESERILTQEIDLSERVRAKRVLDPVHYGRPECFRLRVDRTAYSGWDAE